MDKAHKQAIANLGRCHLETILAIGDVNACITALLAADVSLPAHTSDFDSLRTSYTTIKSSLTALQVSIIALVTTLEGE